MNRRDAIKALVAMPAVVRISVAQLKPDDVIVLESDEHLGVEQLQAIKRQAEQVWPGRKIVVLEKGLRLKVMAASEAV